MRAVHGHESPGDPEPLAVDAVDAPGPGGASHLYRIGGYCPAGNPSSTFLDDDHVDILFQHGTVPEHGKNGVTPESLLAVVIDRLMSFQGGEFACRENDLALESARIALGCLHMRTERRLLGVEGRSAI